MTARPPIDLTRCHRASDRQMAASRRGMALLAAAGEVEAPARWFVLRVAQRQDTAVAESLKAARIDHWMAVKTVDIRRRGGRGGKARPTYDKPVLPGYLFVRVVPSAHQWAFLAQLPGVVGILGDGVRPVPVDDEKITRLQAFLDQDPQALRVLTDAMRRGEKVAVTDGPFADFPAVVRAVRGGRALVEVMLFGRKTPLRLDLAQLVKIG